MLMLALACIRAGSEDEPLRMVMRGQFAEGVQLGMLRLQRRSSQQAAAADAVLGQVIGRALIQLGREEEAEELFRRQLRIYEMGARPYVRWMSSLDHGCMQLALNRLSRAAHAFNAVADDDTAPAAMRIEALAGLAACVRGLGVYGRAERTLAHAQSLAAQHACTPVQQVLRAMRLETAVMQDLRAFDEGGDACAHTGSSDNASLHRRLQESALELADIPLAHQRMHFLATLMDRTSSGPESLARITENINEIRLRKLGGHERECRIEAALAQVSQSDSNAAQAVLDGLIHDEETIRRHRHSLELKYCLSRIYALQGRHKDALRIYKEHVAQALARLHAELSHLPYSRCLERQGMAESSDSLKMLLPLRYRRAYQYIMEHLGDRDLSVREVATHVDVTERALQTAFRTHLGMAPAELIRRRRIERIHKELREAPERHKVLDVAQRWGMTSRSTVAQHYRQLFNETPSMMLRGGAEPSSAPVDQERHATSRVADVVLPTDIKVV